MRAHTCMWCRAAGRRSDYRIVRAWPGWLVYRRWLDGWSRVGGRMTFRTAHSVVNELADWQHHAGPEAAKTMRLDTSDLRQFFDRKRGGQVSPANAPQPGRGTELPPPTPGSSGA